MKSAVSFSRTSRVTDGLERRRRERILCSERICSVWVPDVSWMLVLSRLVIFPTDWPSSTML